GRRGNEPGLDLSVGGGGHQHVAPAVAGGVDDEPAIGSEAGAFVVAGFGEAAAAAAGQVHQLQLERPAVTRDVGHLLAVRADRGADVVAAVEGDALGIAAGSGDAVDLRAAPAVAHEIDAAAVGRPRGLGVDRGAGGESVHVLAVAPHQVELGDAVAAEGDGELLAVGR